MSLSLTTFCHQWDCEDGHGSCPLKYCIDIIGLISVIFYLNIRMKIRYAKSSQSSESDTGLKMTTPLRDLGSNEPWRISSRGQWYAVMTPWPPTSKKLRELPNDWRRPPGHPRHTWLCTLEADLQPHLARWKHLVETAKLHTGAC